MRAMWVNRGSRDLRPAHHNRLEIQPRPGRHGPSWYIAGRVQRAGRPSLRCVGPLTTVGVVPLQSGGQHIQHLRGTREPRQRRPPSRRCRNRRACVPRLHQCSRCSFSRCEEPDRLDERRRGNSCGRRSFRYCVALCSSTAYGILPGSYRLSKQDAVCARITIEQEKDRVQTRTA